MTIKKNEDGTYEVVFGIAEGVNSLNGLFFRREVVEKELQRLNADPYPLISELGYPTTYPDEAQMVKHARLQDLHRERACGYLSDFAIKEGSPPMITGRFTPAGMFENTAIKLIDGKAQVRFGLRASSFPRERNGQKVMMLESIVTWDLITDERNG